MFGKDTDGIGFAASIHHIEISQEFTGFYLLSGPHHPHPFPFGLLPGSDGVTQRQQLIQITAVPSDIIEGRGFPAVIVAVGHLQAKLLCLYRLIADADTGEIAIHPFVHIAIIVYLIGILVVFEASPGSILFTGCHR